MKSLAKHQTSAQTESLLSRTDPTFSNFSWTPYTILYPYRIIVKSIFPYYPILSWETSLRGFITRLLTEFQQTAFDDGRVPWFESDGWHTVHWVQWGCAAIEYYIICTCNNFGSAVGLYRKRAIYIYIVDIIHNFSYTVNAYPHIHLSDVFHQSLSWKTIGIKRLFVNSHSNPSVWQSNLGRSWEQLKTETLIQRGILLMIVETLLKVQVFVRCHLHTQRHWKTTVCLAIVHMYKQQASLMMISIEH